MMTVPICSFFHLAVHKTLGQMKRRVHTTNTNHIKKRHPNLLVEYVQSMRITSGLSLNTASSA